MADVERPVGSDARYMTRITTSIGCILLLMAASLAVAIPSASAQPASNVAGTWQAIVPILTTTYQPSPTDPTTGSYEGVGSSLWQGTWTGVTYYTSRGTLNVASGAGSGAFDETFAGRSTDGGTGTITFTWTYTVDPHGHILFWGRIIDASGDFTGARGTLTAEGTVLGAVSGNGTYHGHWSRSGSR
jgi:hypothetical protein